MPKARIDFVSWPSDVTVLRFLLTCRASTSVELAEWMLCYAPLTQKRTRVERVAQSLVRLQNDGLIYRQRNEDDERILEYVARR